MTESLAKWPFCKRLYPTSNSKLNKPHCSFWNPSFSVQWQRSWNTQPLTSPLDHSASTGLGNMDKVIAVPTFFVITCSVKPKPIHNGSFPNIIWYQEFTEMGNFVRPIVVSYGSFDLSQKSSFCLEQVCFPFQIFAGRDF